MLEWTEQRPPSPCISHRTPPRLPVAQDTVKHKPLGWGRVRGCELYQVTLTSFKDTKKCMVFSREISFKLGLKASLAEILNRAKGTMAAGSHAEIAWSLGHKPVNQNTVRLVYNQTQAHMNSSFCLYLPYIPVSMGVSYRPC